MDHSDLEFCVDGKLNLTLILKYMFNFVPLFVSEREHTFRPFLVIAFFFYKDDRYDFDASMEQMRGGNSLIISSPDDMSSISTKTSASGNVNPSDLPDKAISLILNPKGRINVATAKASPIEASEMIKSIPAPDPVVEQVFSDLTTSFTSLKLSDPGKSELAKSDLFLCLVKAVSIHVLRQFQLNNNHLVVMQQTQTSYDAKVKGTTISVRAKSDISLARMVGDGFQEFFVTECKKGDIQKAVGQVSLYMHSTRKQWERRDDEVNC